MERKEKHTIDLLPGDTLHMDNPLPAVNLDDLSFTSFVCASHNLDLVVLSHGYRPNLKIGIPEKPRDEDFAYHEFYTRYTR